MRAHRQLRKWHELIWNSITAHIEGTDDELIVGAKLGYAIFTRSSGKLEYIRKVWDERDGPGKAERYVRPHEPSHVLIIGPECDATMVP